MDSVIRSNQVRQTVSLVRPAIAFAGTGFPAFRGRIGVRVENSHDHATRHGGRRIQLQLRPRPRCRPPDADFSSCRVQKDPAALFVPALGIVRQGVSPRLVQRRPHHRVTAEFLAGRRTSWFSHASILAGFRRINNNESIARACGVLSTEYGVENIAYGVQTMPSCVPHSGLPLRILPPYPVLGTLHSVPRDRDSA